MPIKYSFWSLSFNLCAGMPKHSVMSHAASFDGRDGHVGNKCGDQLITRQASSGRLASLPNIIDPVARVESKRSRFSKKWATIDGSLGRREFDPFSHKLIKFSPSGIHTDISDANGLCRYASWHYET